MRRKLSIGLVLSPLALALVVLGSSWVGGSEPAADLAATASVGPHDGVDPQRLIFVLQYLGLDYAGAIKAGRVVNFTEYQEMTEFAATAVDWYLKLRPEHAGRATHRRLQELQQMIASKAEPLDVRNATTALIRDLTIELQVPAYPTATPNLKRGRELYATTCAPCHGLQGDGNGPIAGDLNPRPTDFRDPDFMRKATPYQFFNAITYGVEGTAMPSHYDALDPQRRWDIAFYLMTLRRGFRPVRPEGDIPVSERQLATLSNQALVADLVSQARNGRNPVDSLYWEGVVDYLRAHPPEMRPNDRLAYAEQHLAMSYTAYEKGRLAAALNHAVDAYLNGIEPIEPLVASRDQGLLYRTENQFVLYRNAIRDRSAPYHLRQRYDALMRTLVDLHATIEPSQVETSLVAVQSLTIILREGLEAALLVALMLTYLVASGNARLRRHVYTGVATGLGAGVALWAGSRLFLSVTPFHQAALEGFSSLLAAAVLFSVSFWMLHKIDLRKWKSFIRAQAEKALGTGSGFALGFAAFLAVFREAFETVLFYQVLLTRYEAARSVIALGFVLGAVALVLIVYLMFRFSARLPLKPFFSLSGLLFGMLAFTFAGYGVRELQNAGLLSETVLPFDLSWNFLEIHPTFEGVVLQLGLLFSFLMGWFGVVAEKVRLARVGLSSTAAHEA